MPAEKANVFGRYRCKFSSLPVAHLVERYKVRLGGLNREIVELQSQLEAVIEAPAFDPRQ